MVVIMSWLVETTVFLLFVLCFDVDSLAATTFTDECGDLPDVPKATKPDGQASYSPSQTLRYRCQRGYEGRGFSRIRCSLGQWEWADPSGPFSCRAVSCGPPPDVDHGSFTGHDFTFGSAVTFTCDLGYKVRSRTGLLTIVCQANGRWTVISASCEEVKCAEPTAPQHGSMSIDSGSRGPGGLSVGSVYSFQCENAYHLRGYKARESMRRRCLPDGTWDNREPECIEIHCTPLTVLQNGVVDAEGSEYGSLATFHCNQGYEMVPTSRTVTVCMRNRQWSVPLPECKPDHCGKLPYVANTRGDSRDRFDIGTEQSYWCSWGYTQQGVARMRCTHDGWQPTRQGAPFYCQENCKEPAMNVPNIRRHFSSSRTYPVGTELNMDCQADYTQKGDNRIKCKQTDATLSPVWRWVDPSQPFECEEKCRDPTIIDHIKQQFGTYVVGETFTVDCAIGYSPPSKTVHYNKRLQCRKNRRWEWLPSDDPIISCHANCGNPPSVADATSHRSGSFPIGEEINHQCSRGFIARGDNRQRCTIHGWEWFPNNRFSCEAVPTAPSVTAVPTAPSVTEVPTAPSVTTVRPIPDPAGDGFCQRPRPDVNVVYFYRETPLTSLQQREFDHFPIASQLTCVCASPGEMFVQGLAHAVYKKDITCQASGWEACQCDFIPRDVTETPRIRIRNAFTVLPDGSALVKISRTNKIVLDCEYIVWQDRYNGHPDNHAPQRWSFQEPYGFGVRQILAGKNGRTRDFLGDRYIMNQTLTIWKKWASSNWERTEGTYTCPKNVADAHGFWYVYRNSIDIKVIDPSKDRCCPNPGGIGDGSVEVSSSRLCADRQSYNKGTRLKFKCNHGFSRKGRAKRSYCLNDGSWSHRSPICQRKAGCTGTPRVDNAALESKTKSADGVERVQMKCKTGYTRLTGSDRWKCEDGKWVLVHLGETPLRCEKGYCQGGPAQIDRTCSDEFKKGEGKITDRKVLFGGGIQVKEYYLNGSIIGTGCGDRAKAWMCNSGTWDTLHLCHGLPRGQSGYYPPDSNITAVHGDLFLPGTPCQSSGNNQWVCDEQGQWTPSQFCDGLPSGHHSSCIDLKRGQILTAKTKISCSWMDSLCPNGQRIVQKTYFTNNSLFSSKCGTSHRNNRPSKWLCQAGTWLEWLNCDAPPDALKQRNLMKLHPDERSDETTWPNGRVLRMKCLLDLTVKPGSDDSWTCRGGYWETTDSSLSAPECQQEDLSGSMDQGCDTDVDVPNAPGSIITTDYQYNDEGDPVYTVNCNDGSTRTLTCKNDVLVPDPSVICLSG